MLKTMMIAATMIGAGALYAAQAFADEVVIHRDRDATPPPSSSTTVEKHESTAGCASKTVRKENDEGDSKTVHSTNCD